MKMFDVIEEIKRFTEYARLSDQNEITLGAGTLEHWLDKLERALRRGDHETPVSLQPSVENPKQASPAQVDWEAILLRMVAELDAVLSKKPKKPKRPIDPLIEAFNADQNYAWTWHCNLAMLLADAGVEAKRANEFAATFMKSAFNVDVSNFPEWCLKHALSR